MTEVTKIPSIRLTNLDRDRVASAAISAAFDPRFAELKTSEDRIGRLCYETVFSTAERKAARSMPIGWLRLDNCLGFNVNGMSLSFDLLDEGVPVPATRGGYGNRYLGAISNPEVIAQVEAFLASKEALKVDHRKAQQSLKALLYSVTTLKALRDLWPEGEAFFAGLTSKTGAPGLPAPQVTEINAMLGLPVREAA